MNGHDDRAINRLDGDHHRLVHVDPDRTVRLDTAGMYGYSAGIVILADGDTEPVLLCRAGIGHETYMPPGTDHDQCGPLPPRWRHRVLLAPIRCGHRTATGRPCRQPVRDPSRGCHRHQRTEPPNDTLAAADQ